MERDPVCGMRVDDKNSRLNAVYRGVTYYFCGGICNGSFNSLPPMRKRVWRRIPSVA